MFITLCIGIVPYLYGLNHPNPYNTLSSYCKAHNYIVQSCSMAYRLLMAIACIDRYLHTSNNISRQEMLNIRVTYRIIIITTIVCLCLSIHVSIWSDISGNICTITSVPVVIYNNIYVFIVSGLIPIPIMLICALLIQRNLANKRKNVERMRNIRGREHQQKDRQVLLMLSVQILVYLISNLPWLGIMSYLVFTYNQIKSPYQNTIESLIRYFFYFLAYTYPVVSFYMYTLSSRTFRRELMKMLKSALICYRKQSIAPVLGHTTRIQYPAN